MIYAHYDKSTGKSQSLDEHLAHVSEEMTSFMDTVSYDELMIDKTIFKEVGLYHDLGKLTHWFQEYLLYNSNNGNRKNHSLISAMLYFASKDCSQEEAMLLACIAIVCHHKSLESVKPSEEQYDYIDEQYDDCIAQKQLLDMGDLIANDKPGIKDFQKMWRKTLRHIEKKNNPAYFFTLQLLFSKLISADKRDSASILDYGLQPVIGDADAYIKKKTGGSNISLNGDRNIIRNSVLQQFMSYTDQELKDQRLYTLTAPTGTGKTLTSISAAIELSKRLEKIYGNTFHIISAIPFLNILEQTIVDYENIFGEVLVDSSMSFDRDASSEAVSVEQKMLLQNAWMSPVILTTFVKFFESILTSNNKKLLKINRLANAIVIMDEIQALEAENYPLYAVVIDMISRCYGTRFILMTATQPVMFDCAKVYDYCPQSRIELLPSYKRFFKKLKRTEIIDVRDLITDFDSLITFIWENQLYTQKLLIVVNTIKDSINLYHKLVDEGWDCLYLSTNITSVDRKKVIEEAKQCLKEDASPFIMVSTQTIEAGVDLDFDMAFRDMAPMESVIQTCGRVNRSGTKGEHFPVYIFDSFSAKRIYSYMAISYTGKTLDTYSGINKRIPEEFFQQMIEDYNKSIIEGQAISFQSDLYKNGVLKLDYSVIDKFKMIKDGDRVSILFIQSHEVEDIIKQICEIMLLTDKTYSSKIRLQKLLAELGRYSVDVFKSKVITNLPISFAAYSEDLCGIKIPLNYFVVPYDDLDRYYNETGYISESPDVFLF